MMLMLFGIMFVVSTQPMMMVSVLIMIIILYSLILYNMLMGYWFSYLLVMVMLSGMMVLFTYMVSLNPNESFEGYNILYLLFMLIFMVGYEFLEFSDAFFHMSLCLWSSFYSMFTIFMVVFLLMMMLVVVWLSFINEGSLRV